ncbi:MAG: pilus assembly protein HicB [Lentimicrobiaceae bacterium]|nr:pilus assembly protein HicB [Lentimicrobiaceae bacterium]
MKTIALIEKGKDGMYTIFTPKVNSFIIGIGNTVEEAKADFENSVKEVNESYIDNNEELPKELQNIAFEYKYDIASFFNYFDWINVTKFAKKAKMNGSLMRRYRGGEYISQKQVAKIEKTLNELGKEISGIKLTV